ncbi:Uncharacterised protein [Vibrio cholerae]|nr:Uncharacterised protein [Vibrio cholerae]
MLNVELFEQIFQLVLTLFMGQLFAGLQDGHDVVFDREFAKDRRFLRQITNAHP